MSFGRLAPAKPARGPMGDINMTPLIDVMLVLLIIFMVTAPLIASSLKLDLPQTEGTSPSDAPEALALTLDAEGRLFIGSERAELAEVHALAERAKPDTEVQLRADTSVPYGRVAELIGVLQQAGLSRIAFVAAPAASAP